MVAKIHTRLCVSGEEGHSLTTIFIGSLHFFGFNWGQSYLATLVTPQNCTKCLEILLLLYNLLILASEQKKSLLFRAGQRLSNFRYKKQFWLFFIFSNFWGTFWEITESRFWEISSNLWKTLGLVLSRLFTVPYTPSRLSRSTQEKLRTMLIQNFKGQTRCNFGDSREANTKFCEAEKVYHGRFEIGKYSYPWLGTCSVGVFNCIWYSR